MPKESAHSKKESISRKARRTINVTSYTEATKGLERARISADIKGAYSSKTSRTWTAGETIIVERHTGEYHVFVFVLQLMG